MCTHAQNDMFSYTLKMQQNFITYQGRFWNNRGLVSAQMKLVAKQQPCSNDSGNCQAERRDGNLASFPKKL